MWFAKEAPLRSFDARLRVATEYIQRIEARLEKMEAIEKKLGSEFISNKAKLVVEKLKSC